MLGHGRRTRQVRSPDLRANIGPSNFIGSDGREYGHSNFNGGQARGPACTLRLSNGRMRRRIRASASRLDSRYELRALVADHGVAVSLVALDLEFNREVPIVVLDPSRAQANAAFARCVAAAAGLRGCCVHDWSPPRQRRRLTSSAERPRERHSHKCSRLPVRRRGRAC